jgi:hypothetical protein
MKNRTRNRYKNPNPKNPSHSKNRQKTDETTIRARRQITRRHVSSAARSDTLTLMRGLTERRLDHADQTCDDTCHLSPETTP